MDPLSVCCLLVAILGGLGLVAITIDRWAGKFLMDYRFVARRDHLRHEMEALRLGIVKKVNIWSMVVELPPTNRACNLMSLFDYAQTLWKLSGDERVIILDTTTGNIEIHCEVCQHDVQKK